MAGSTTKKVVLYRYERESLSGFVNPSTWLTAAGIELLSPVGTVSIVSYREIKVVCFVRDFDGSPLFQERRLYHTRPKTPGLWVRAQFRDNDFIEGVMTNDLLSVEPEGFTLSPPDPDTNNQRIFLPRASLKEFRVVAAIGATKGRGAKPDKEKQIGLFG